MPTLTNAGILRWAARRGATNPRRISDLMQVSTGTVRAWSALPRTEASPRVLLIIAAIEAGAAAPDISTPADIAAARDRTGLPTLVALAAQLGVSRQTLNSWGRTCAVPAWVPLACAGLTALAGRPLT